MMTSKISLLTISFLFLSRITVFGQDDPPPMAMPNDSSIILVDKIIAVTEHEKYFIDYCTNKVKAYAQENSWTKEKTNTILQSIKFKYYNTTIYNSYAFYSINQLKKLIEALTLLNTNPKKHLTMVLTNSMMQNNLDSFVEGVIEGKYVM